MFCIEIIAILILILVLSKHSLCPRILEQGLLLFWDEENVLCRNNGNPYSDIGSLQTFSLSQNTTNRDYYYSRTKRMFCIQIIVILILILFLFKHSLCPRIIVIPVCSILGQRECLDRTNIRIRIAIISIQNILFVPQ